MSSVEAKPIADTWKWEAPGKAVAVELDLRVVDGLGAEVLRGLGSVPKRGVEVGGVLLGSVTPGAPGTVTIRGFEPIAIEYLHGPQYRLSDRDRQNFTIAMARLRHQALDLRPVGFYRSDTGDALSLSTEDRSILDEFFPHPEDVALLIHPAVLKSPTAAILLRENGAFPAGASFETFNFRRRELTGIAAETPQGEWNRHARREETPVPPEVPPPPVAPLPVEEPQHQARPAPIMFLPDEPPRSRMRLAVAVLLLALLALGATAGDWYARRQAPAVSAATLKAEDPYAIGLSAEQQDGNVLLHWNRNARALQAAERSQLTITEGDRSKTIDLDLDQLRNGVVLYRHVAPEIRFRLEVQMAGDRSLSETLVWHPPAAR
jgi:hypothetical protein